MMRGGRDNKFLSQPTVNRASCNRTESPSAANGRAYAAKRFGHSRSDPDYSRKALRRHLGIVLASIIYVLGTRWTAPAFIAAVTGLPTFSERSSNAPRVTIAMSGKPHSIFTWTITPCGTISLTVPAR